MADAHNDPQFIRGRDKIGLAMRLLLEQNGLSHTDMQDFYRWCCPDRATWFNRSQISTLRNMKLPKPGPQIFVALSQINLRLAQLAGDDSPPVKALAPLGPLPASLWHLKDPDHKPFFITNPETGWPMGLGELYRLFCGELEMEGERWQNLPSLYTDDDGEQISGRLAVWAQRWMVKEGLIPLEARQRIMDAYPVKEVSRQKRLWDVILGGTTYGGRELREEADALRFLVGTLDRGAAFSLREFDRWCRS